MQIKVFNHAQYYAEFFGDWSGFLDGSLIKAGALREPDD